MRKVYRKEHPGPGCEQEPMPRVPRWMQLARDTAYDVMTGGHNREALFAGAHDSRDALGSLGTISRRANFLQMPPTGRPGPAVR